MKTIFAQYYVMFDDNFPDGIVYKRGERPESNGFSTTLFIGDEQDAKLWKRALTTVKTEGRQLRALLVSDFAEKRNGRRH